MTFFGRFGGRITRAKAFSRSPGGARPGILDGRKARNARSKTGVLVRKPTAFSHPKETSHAKSEPC